MLATLKSAASRAGQHGWERAAPPHPHAHSSTYVVAARLQVRGEEVHAGLEGELGVPGNVLLAHIAAAHPAVLHLGEGDDHRGGMQLLELFGHLPVWLNILRVIASRGKHHGALHLARQLQLVGPHKPLQAHRRVAPGRALERDPGGGGTVGHPDAPAEPDAAHGGGADLLQVGEELVVDVREDHLVEIPGPLVQERHLGLLPLRRRLGHGLPPHVVRHHRVVPGGRQLVTDLLHAALPAEDLRPHEHCLLPRSP
mmetsp:Transcript_16965/g.40851  ORF Transcript_16965/g.40851 Transcript_16965/m.40851 type:complete len:255 (-) Transcript_16965:157-921(-)